MCCVGCCWCDYYFGVGGQFDGVCGVVVVGQVYVVQFDVVFGVDYDFGMCVVVVFVYVEFGVCIGEDCFEVFWLVQCGLVCGGLECVGFYVVQIVELVLVVVVDVFVLVCYGQVVVLVVVIVVVVYYYVVMFVGKQLYGWVWYVWVGEYVQCVFGCGVFYWLNWEVGSVVIFCCCFWYVFLQQQCVGMELWVGFEVFLYGLVQQCVGQ